MTLVLWKRTKKNRETQNFSQGYRMTSPTTERWLRMQGSCTWCFYLLPRVHAWYQGHHGKLELNVQLDDLGEVAIVAVLHLQRNGTLALRGPVLVGVRWHCTVADKPEPILAIAGALGEHGCVRANDRCCI